MTENGPVTSAGHKDEDHAQFGGFPVFEAATPGPGFGEFLTGMRRLQDLAVSTDPDDDTWDAAAQQVNALVQVLEPYRCGEGVGPAGRTPKLPGAGNLLMPEWKVTRFDSDGVELIVTFSRYHVGGNNAVHGGMVAMMFDVMFGMVIHAIGRPISRTAFLHVDYRNITPIDVPLTVRGRQSRAEGRKTFVTAELIGPEGTLLAEANGLMVRLLPGQP